MVRLSLTLDQERRIRFLHLFQNGVGIYAKSGCSIRSFLCDQLGILPEYVAQRLLVVFLDGRPVDDIDEAFVRAGSTLALSAAVPGLVGATVRRGGTYACLRNSITYRETGTRPACEESTIRLKLFNVVARELGPRLLETGVFTSWLELEDLLAGIPEAMLEGSSDAIRDRKSSETIMLTVLPESMV